MDRRRAAGALLALAACIACSAAAPTTSDHTDLELYEGVKEGCYYNFQHYGEGDRIMTNEPCLNCTCHNRMLMCYLRVCPFTKPIGQDCTVEKRADQCCPIVTCPDVPVDLLTSTSTTSPAEYGATGLGKLDKYGCSIHGKYFPEGSKVPPTPNKPCEHCYCIRNMTTCVMQECTLHVDGCTPIYHKDVCCPVRYSCDHPEDEIPLLDDMSTTTRPTPGFLLTTTTLSPVTQMSQDCVHNDRIIADGASITTEKACEHCYCMKGDIVCVVQECGAPMENEGKNCTSLPPRAGQCCPDTYICEGDESSTEIESLTEPVTEILSDKLTTLSPPRRPGVEGSGYRIEPDKEVNTESSNVDLEPEGSGEEYETSQATQEPLIPGKPIENIPVFEDSDQYITVSTQAPILESSDKDVDKIAIGDNIENNTDNPQGPSEYVPIEGDSDKKDSDTEIDLKPYQPVTVISTLEPESINKLTTEPSEYLNTVSGPTYEQKHEVTDSHAPTTITLEEVSTIGPKETEKPIPSLHHEQDVTSPTEHVTPSEELITSTELSSEPATIKEISGSEITVETTTGLPTKDESGIFPSHEVKDATNIPISTTEKQSTEPDHSQNTVAVSEEDSIHKHQSSLDDDKPDLDNISSVTNPSSLPVSEETATTEPDKGLNTIPNEINEESMRPKPTTAFETKVTEPSNLSDTTGQGDDLKLSTESDLLEPDNQANKGDTTTTEASFRKEDDISETKPQQELERTTVKSEFIDEALIPTSSHDEKQGTSSNIPSLDEYITTMSPDYIQADVKDTEKPATESDLIDDITSQGVTEKNKHSTLEYQVEPQSTTEKSTDVDKEDDSRDEPSRIPGEGDCLLNGITYRNNTIVPSSNKCHASCKCISSIIRCDPIICSLPPHNMDSCQSVYDPPDSCCPTYVCDHSRETVPPKSDSQMSGTESPTPSLSIDCRGDQCEFSEQTKQPLGTDKPCTSDSCLLEDDHKSDLDKCGPLGCDNNEPRPDSTLPSVSQSGCLDKNCESSVESCPDGECQSLPSVAPCKGESCKATSEESQSPQPCESEADCKKIEISHDKTVPSKPISGQEISCNEENGCQYQSLDCVGDEPCRRKDVPVDQDSSSNCEGSDCKQQPDKQAIELPIPEKTPMYIPTIDKESFENLGTQVTEDVLIETTQKPLEQEYTEHSILETMHDITTEKTPIDEDIATDELILAEGTKAPTHHEGEEMSKPTEGDITTKPGSSEEENIKIPIEPEPILEEAHTDKIDSMEKEITPIPDSEDGVTDEPSVSVIIDDHTDKSVSVKEDTTKLDDVFEEHSVKPSLVEEKDKEIPDNLEAEHEPVFNEKEGTTASPHVGEISGKPILDDTLGTKTPDAALDTTTSVNSYDKDISEPIDEKEIYRPTSTEKTITKPVSTEEKDTKTPEEEISEPTIFDKDFTKESDHEYTTRPYIDDKTIPTSMIDNGAYTNSPVSTEDYAMNNEQNKEPVFIQEKGTTVFDIMEDHTDKTSLIERTSTNTPDTTTDKQDFNEKYATQSTDKFVDRDTKEPNSIEDLATGIPDLVTDKTVASDDEVKENPVLIEDELSVVSKDDESNVVSDDGTEIPQVDTDSETKNPMVIDDSTELSVAITSDKVTEIPSLAEEITDNEVIIDDNIKYKPPITDKETEKPDDVVHGSQIPNTQTDSPATTEQHMPTFITPEEEGSGNEEPEIVSTKPQDVTSELPGIIGDDQLAVTEIEPERQTERSQTEEGYSTQITSETPDDLHVPESPEPEIINSDDNTFKQPEQSQQPETNPQETYERTTVKSPHDVSSSESETETLKPITGEEETYTDTPTQQSVTTGKVLTEPHESYPSESPINIPVKEESSTQRFEDTVNYETPEPTSAIEMNEQEIKSEIPEESDKVVTSISVMAVTEPVKASTEIEDSSITGQEQTGTVHYAETTETIQPYITERPDQTPEIITESDTSIKSDEKITKHPEEGDSHHHEGNTEASTIAPHKFDTSTLLYGDVTTNEALSATEYLQPTSSQPSRKTEPISDLVTNMPVNVQTESEEKPIVTEGHLIYEEDVTKTPELSSQSHLDSSTEPFDIFVTGEQASTRAPESHVTVTSDRESLITTESHIITDDTGVKSEKPQENDDDRDPTKSEDTEIKTPEKPLDIHQVSTEYSPSEGMYSKIPETQITTVAAPSIVNSQVTEDQATEKDNSQTITNETGPPSEEYTTEKIHMVPELTTPELNKISTEATYETSSQYGISETTPYMIELEEHTHRIIGVSTTSTDTAEEITTSSSPSVSTEQDTAKLDYNPSSLLPPIKESQPGEMAAEVPEKKYEITTQKADVSTDFNEKLSTVEDTLSTEPPAISDNHQDEKQYTTSSSTIQDLNDAITSSISTDTEKEPIYNFNNEITTEKTSSGVHIIEDTTTESENEIILSTRKPTSVNEEEINQYTDSSMIPTIKPEKISPLDTDSQDDKVQEKPSSETQGTLPPTSDDKYDKVGDISEGGEATPSAFEDKDGKPTEKPSTETRETVPPVFENKETVSVEKVSSETTETSSPGSEDKYDKVDDTSETSETISPTFEDKEKPSSETGETLPPISEDKYGKPEDSPSSETGETTPPAFDNKPGKPMEEPSSETGERFPPISDDKYDKPDEVPASGTGETKPSLYEDKDGKPIEKPGSPTAQTLSPVSDEKVLSTIATDLDDTLHEQPNEETMSPVSDSKYGKPDETAPPVTEDKDSKPIEKPTDETGETLPPVSDDKYVKPDVTPHSEPGETISPTLEDKDDKPFDKPSSEPGELPPVSEDKYGKPTEMPGSKTEEILPTTFEDKDDKPVEKPSSETGEQSPPVSEDTNNKPEGTPNSETTEPTPPAFADKDSKPIEKPSSETDDMPGSDTGEIKPPGFENKDGKPIEKPSTETGETLPSVSDDKYGKPDDTASSETEKTKPSLEDKDGKPVEKPTDETGEILPPVSDDKYGKPDDTTNNETGETIPSTSEDKDDKPITKPGTETEEPSPAISEDKDKKPIEKPSTQTTQTLPPVSEENVTPILSTDMDDKHHEKPSTETMSPLSEDKYGKPDDMSSVESDEIKPPASEDKTETPVEQFSSATTTSLPVEKDKLHDKPSEEIGEDLPSVSEDKYGKPDEKPISEVNPPSPTSEIPKPLAEAQPTDELPPTDEDSNFPPSSTGYGEPDYVEEDQAFGPGTCRYGGKVYVSAQQIPRDDPCDFCFCFRSDIICLQQSCPPPIHGCHEEPIQGFCCPRYECPVSMATTLNVTTTTTTTTTTLPPHFPTHSYKGAAQRRGCQIKGHTYKVGEVVRSASGPCLHCTCGGDGQMKCDPKACTPEPMLRQMIAAAVSAKRRR